MCAERRGGFTLLEAVFTLAILGMVASAALSAVSAGLQSAVRATHATEGAALAADRLARLELLEADAVARVPDSLKAGRFPAPMADYTWIANTAPVRAERDLFELTVTVRWEGGEVRLQSRAYRPLPAEPRQ